ncbi:MAG: PHP domain-containing protein, partial [Negativicutes bacterium]|nr:PHP domain-containing protein [Negativicutes bacterium]
MEKYCFVPQTGDWQRLVEGCPLSGVREAVVQKIEVDPQSDSWLVYVEFAGPAALEPDALADFLKSRLAAAAVTVVPLSLPWQAAVQYICRHWSQLISWWWRDEPAVMVVLGTAAVVPVATGLEVRIAGKSVADRLAGTNVTEKLRQKLGLLSSGPLDVRFVVAEEMGEADQPADEWEAPVCLPGPDSGKAARATRRSGDGKVWWGRSFRGQPQPLANVREETKDVVVAGRVDDIRLIDNGGRQVVLTFVLLDETDGIRVKLLAGSNGESRCSPAEWRRRIGGLAEKLQQVGAVTVRGEVVYDKYERDLVIYPQSVIALNGAGERSDQWPVKRVELHAHTKMSTMDGLATVDELITTAARWGHPAIAITDHGVVQSFPEAREVAASLAQKGWPIKIIYGLEGYLFSSHVRESSHVVILARNRDGLRNLFRLVSISHLNYFYKRPRIPRQELANLRQGLLIGSACEAGEIVQAILRGETDQRLLDRADFYDYLEIQPLANNMFLVRNRIVEDQVSLRQINLKVAWLAGQLDKPLVATGDVHFVNPGDEIYRRILMSGQGYQDAEQQAPLYLRTTDEMLQEFAYLGEEMARRAVIDNPRMIADQIDDLDPLPDRLHPPSVPGAEQMLPQIAWQRAHQLYGRTLPDIVARRMEQELSAIVSHGYAGLYVIAHKLVKKSLADGYLVGSRGSVGSSLVATMAGITEVNPLPPHWRCPQCCHSLFIVDGSVGSGFDLPDRACPRCGAAKMCKDGHDIPFSVFMGFEGDKVPDIDLNFSGDYQAAAHKYVEELFGPDNVFRAGTVSTLADRTAFGFVKKYFEQKGQAVRDVFINQLVRGCTGVRRTTGQHPGGIIVLPQGMDIHQFTPIQRPADDVKTSIVTTHFDYHAIDNGLVKLDILGHDDPTTIRFLEDETGADATTVPFDDQATLSLFSSSHCLGSV